jgi:hypothetical protein
MLFVILDSVMGLLQVEFGSSELRNSAIITFHTDMLISYCLTQHNIKPTPWSTLLLEKLKGAQLFRSLTEPEVSIQCSQQRRAR